MNLSRRIRIQLVAFAVVAAVAAAFLFLGYIKLPAMEPVNCARLIGHFSCIERWRKQLLSHGRLGGMKTDKAKGDERGTKECH